MMIKAILAWAGIMAARAPIPRTERPVNDAVHDAVSREAAIFAGSQALVRRSDRLAHVMACDPANRERIDKDVDGMRALTARVLERKHRP